MEPFPLMSLDFPPLKAVVSSFDEYSLLNFALSSPHCRSLAKQRRNKMKIDYFSMNYHKDSCCLEIQFDEYRKLFWKINTLENLVRDPEQTIDTFYVNNVKVENIRRPTDYKYVIKSFSENDRLACFHIADLLLDIFETESMALYIHRENHPDISHILKWPKLNQVVQNFTLIPYFRITDEEFLLFQRNVRPKRSLTCNFFSYDNRSHGIQDEMVYDYIYVLNSQWFTREDLLNTDCRMVRLEESSLTNENIGEFIQKWYFSDNMKLEFAEILIDGVDLSKITENLPTVNLKTVKEAKQLTKNTLRFVDFRDEEFCGFECEHLIRADGRVATIHVRPSVSLLVVWNEKTPIISD